MLHRILSEGGYRAALYTSPHLVSFTERMRVGEEEISEAEVIDLAESIRKAVEAKRIGLTFFEFVTVMALAYFGRRSVDVAVIEVGMGGKLDATNVVVSRVSVITTIAKDHEAYLGSDLLSIGREKGGIIKAGVPVVCGSLAPEVIRLLEDIARAKGSASFFLGRDFTFVEREADFFDYRGPKWDLKGLSVSLKGRHQRRNASVALSALEAAQDRFPIKETALREGLKTVAWPGRFEIVRRHPTVVLDGAHNPEGAAALAEEIRSFGQGRKVRLLFGVMADKNWSSMLHELSAVSHEVLFTRVSVGRSADPIQLAGAIRGRIAWKIVDNPVRAVNSLLDRAELEDLIVVAGSLYLVGEVRPFLTETGHARPC
jgi:dihydrofolate synthase/folylpolyglutamate synthase